MELELKHVQSYPMGKNGLKWSLQELSTFTMSGITNETLYTCEGTVLNWKKHDNLPQVLFPILRPLSDLNLKKEYINEYEVSFIEHIYCSSWMAGGYILGDNSLGFTITSKEDNSEIFISTVKPHVNTYWIVEEMFKWHFDVFGLIDEGLAIDINTL